MYFAKNCTTDRLSGKQSKIVLHTCHTDPWIHSWSACSGLGDFDPAASSCGVVADFVNETLKHHYRIKTAPLTFWRLIYCKPRLDDYNLKNFDSDFLFDAPVTQMLCFRKQKTHNPIACRTIIVDSVELSCATSWGWLCQEDVVFRCLRWGGLNLKPQTWDECLGRSVLVVPAYAAELIIQTQQGWDESRDDPVRITAWNSFNRYWRIPI